MTALLCAKESERVPCALCGRINDQPFIYLRDPIKQDGVSFPLVKCPDCELVYLNPRLIQAGKVESHPEEYWERKNLSQNIADDNIIARTKKSFLRLLFAEEIAHITKNVTPGGRILEIGCGNGDFLALLSETGYQTVGIEPDPVSFKVAEKKHDSLKFYNTTIESIQLDSNSFNAIIMIHVFEHVADPNRTLEEIGRLLDDSGKLFIYVPNIDSYQFRIFKERYFNLCAPQHMYLYAPSTLLKILKKNNLIAGKVSHQSIRCNSATLVCSLFPGLNPVSLALHSGERGAWLKQLLAYLLTALFIPVTFLEGLSGHGANLFVLARKDKD